VMFRRIARTYNQCIRLVGYTANSEHRWALPDALVRIVHSVGIFVIRLRQEKMASESDRYAASAFQICKLAAWIAADNNDEDPLPSAVGAALLIAKAVGGEPLDWAREVANGIKDQRARETAHLLLDRHLRRMKGEEIEGDIPATARQVVENMAMAIGIDMTNPEDPRAKLVERGIIDANPGRVLRNCEHIFVTLAANPPLAPTAFLARILGLPSIGPKRLHCDLHRHHIRAAGLDSAYAAFKSQYCEKWPDVMPRAPDWEYSDEWQEQENQRHAEFMREFFKSI